VIVCGIVGVLDLVGKREVDPGLLARMNDSLAHRGPDDADVFRSPGVGLGHRRLSIIDLAGGRQPLFNEDNTVVVVFNGEIFNFMELAHELQERGHRFRTKCDTEVIVHGWEEWGPDCVHRFRGQFAFAVWDQNQQTLFLARDRLGIKPLYYAVLPDGRFVFGSELKSLLECPDLPRRLSPRAIEEYFALGYVPDPNTIYRDVLKLAPGHLLRVQRNQPVEPRCYWDADFSPMPVGDEDELCEELIERLRDAVKVRLIADVPLGAFLSGGVDSSAVVSMMAGARHEPVDTCSIGFDHQAYDETAFAERVSKRYGTRHHVRSVKSDSFDLVDRLAGLYDEPFADSSALPTYQVCGLARERVTVALSGDGGDELFAGYRRYRWHQYEEQVRSRLSPALSRALFGPLGRLYPKMDWAPKPLRAKSTFQSLACDTVDGYFNSVSIMPTPLRRSLFSKDFQDSLEGYEAVEVIRRHMARAPAETALARVQYVDLKTYLPGDILTKVDRASMAHALEVRVPILDHLFLGWASRIPSGLALKGREGKYIFKKALEPHLPRDLLYREKMGFAVPLAKWFRTDLRERVQACAESSALLETGIFDPAFLRTAVQHHVHGLRDHAALLWALVMFESFLTNVHPASRAPQPVSGLRSPAMAAS